MDLYFFLQWAATLVTVLAAWLVASSKQGRRRVGFWAFLGSNMLWVAWGWHDHAYALMAMQLALGIMNIRGVEKNEQA